MRPEFFISSPLWKVISRPFFDVRDTYNVQQLLAFLLLTSPASCPLCETELWDVAMPSCDFDTREARPAEAAQKPLFVRR
jgi:hypothetical protein